MHKIDRVIVVVIILLGISIPFIFVIAATALTGNGRVDNDNNGDTKESGAGTLATDNSASFTQAASTAGMDSGGKDDGDSDSASDSYSARNLDEQKNQTIIKKRIFLGPGESSTYKFDLPMGNVSGNGGGSSQTHSGYDQLYMSITVFGSHSVRFELLDKSGTSHPCDPAGLCMFVVRGVDSGHVDNLIADKEAGDGNPETHIPIELGDGYQLKVSNPDSSVSQIVDVNIYTR